MLNQLNNFKNVAIIQTAFLGDVALSLYLIQVIRDNCPEIEITFVTTPQASPLVLCSNAINNVITYDKRGFHSGFKGIKNISNQLIERKIECIITPHRSIRSTLLTYFSKPKLSVSFDKSTFSVLYSKRVPYGSDLHEIERNISLLNIFSDIKSNSIPTVDIELDEDDKSFIEYKLFDLGIREKNNLILVAPGSIWETKKWPEEYYAKLCRMLIEKGKKVILIGSKDDRVLCSRISINSSAINMSGETSIPQLLVLMKNAGMTITNDSAPTHFASLVNCPVLTIYGPTSSKFGFGPIGEKWKIVELTGLKCKPCTIHGSQKCPIKTHDCMLHLNPQIVYDAYEAFENS